MSSLFQLLNQASSDGSIAEIAERAHRLLICCQDIHDKSPGKGSENIYSTQLARFNLWASNIGVFAARHASLDYRLRTAPTIRVTIEGNLEIICRHLLSTLKASIKLSDKELDAFFDLPMSKVHSYGTNLLKESASGGKEVRDREMSSVEEVISTLHQLSLAIRRASNRQSLTKLPGLFDYDSGFVALRVPEDDAADSKTTVEAVRFETTSLFEEYVRRVLESRWLRPSREAQMDQEQKDYRSTLFDRCVTTVTKRRRQLSYFRNHQLKLAQHALAKPIFTSQKRSPQPNTGEQLSNQQHGPPVPGETADQGLQLRYEATNAGVSDTVGSGFLSTSLRLAPPSSAPSSTTSSTADGGFGPGGLFGVPPPPKVNDTEKEKACPYCCLVLPAKIFLTQKRAKQWERHLLEDLKPYICLFSNCSQPGKSYSSFQEWQAHLRQPHSHSWVCPLQAECKRYLGRDSLEFNSASEFEIHLSVYHADVQPSSTTDLVHRARRAAALPQWCFVCFEELPSLPLLQKHMTNHFKSMSLLALPWLDDISEEEGVSSDKLMAAPEASVASHHSQADLAGVNIWDLTDTDSEAPLSEPSKSVDNEEFSSMLSDMNANPVKSQDRLWDLIPEKDDCELFDEEEPDIDPVDSRGPSPKVGLPTPTPLSSTTQDRDLATSIRWLEQIKKIHELIPNLSHQSPILMYRPRIAILDTGYDQKAAFFHSSARRRRMKGWKDLVENTLLPVDENGHGTYTVALVMKVAPLADIYVARIATGQALENSAKSINYAIHWASNECKVDIILMPFTFQNEISAISRTIQEMELLRENQILFFAASSSSGRNFREMFPANHESVISIRATNSNGIFLPTNPPIDPRAGVAYGTLGENVLSACLSNKTAEEARSGSSVAAAVATGIAAMTLSIAGSKFPLSPGLQDLWTRRGMLAVFAKMSHDMGNRCFFLSPRDFFSSRTDPENWVSIIEACIENA